MSELGQSKNKSFQNLERLLERFCTKKAWNVALERFWNDLNQLIDLTNKSMERLEERPLRRRGPFRSTLFSYRARLERALSQGGRKAA